MAQTQCLSSRAGAEPHHYQMRLIEWLCHAASQARPSLSVVNHQVIAHDLRRSAPACRHIARCDVIAGRGQPEVTTAIEPLRAFSSLRCPERDDDASLDVIAGHCRSAGAQQQRRCLNDAASDALRRACVGRTQRLRRLPSSTLGRVRAVLGDAASMSLWARHRRDRVFSDAATLTEVSAVMSPVSGQRYLRRLAADPETLTTATFNFPAQTDDQRKP